MFRPAVHALLALVLGGLLGGSWAVAGPPGVAQAASYGHTHSVDRVLRAGCHGYRYRYRLRPPTNDWTLETFLVDRRGEKLASNAFSSDSELKRGHGWFRLCRWNAHAGRMTIKAKLIWYSGYDDHTTWLRKSHFRLLRP